MEEIEAKQDERYMQAAIDAGRIAEENADVPMGAVVVYKGQISDDKPGFNPYRKVAPDDYKLGTAYRKCRDKQAFDLDMQIVEYRSDPRNSR